MTAVTIDTTTLRVLVVDNHGTFAELLTRGSRRDQSRS